MRHLTALELAAAIGSLLCLAYFIRLLVSRREFVCRYMRYLEQRYLVGLASDQWVAEAKWTERVFWAWLGSILCSSYLISQWW